MAHNSFNELAPTIVDHGFTVTPTKGKRPVVQNWNNQRPTVREWLAKVLGDNRYAGHNLGIVCGRVVGIDLDADDPAKAAQLETLAAEHLGPTSFQRVGQAPRTLLLYRPAAGEIIPSKKIAACIDVLSGGRQFIAFGIHPGTGKPYQWIADSPATKRLDDVPEITAAQVNAFDVAVTAAVVSRNVPTIAATIRTTAAAMTARQRSRQGNMLDGGDAIVRDANGRVVDGREKLMRNITAVEYAKDKNTTPRNLANRVWARFIAEADVSRPKGSNPRQRWQLKDALAKARSTCRRRPDLKAPRRSRDGIPASRLHAWRRPGFWTEAERERHLAEIGRRITTASVLAVARVMLDAVDMATGFCTQPIADIAKRASCSTKSVTKARAALMQSGLWTGHRGVLVPMALNSNQAVDRKGRKPVGGNVKVPPLYHLSVVTDPLVPSESKSSSVASKPYQADMLGAPVVDLDAERYRRGILPGDVVAAVRAEMRARGVTQDALAAQLGISRPQLANALAGRFGLSPEPASRLLAWLQKAA